MLQKYEKINIRTNGINLYEITNNIIDWINKIKFNEKGLVPAIAQEIRTGKVLMLAWMNSEAVKKTLELGTAVYYSRSRDKLWVKGETSGQFQVLKDLRLDCDGDAILVLVEQKKDIACHTGRETCFYRSYEDNDWKELII